MEVAPYLNSLTIEDIGVTVSDTEKYLIFVKGHQVPQLVNAGDRIPESTVVAQCMKIGKKVINKVSADVFGFPYVACGIPIREGNEIVGAVSFVISIEKQEKLLSLAEELSSGLEELTQSSNLIDEGSEKLFNISNKLLTKSNETNTHMDETDGILRFIQNIASQTNLLGLNAAIEAARVGQEGKGFGVVAQEIRKLAQNSSDSIQKIEEIIKGIRETSNEQGEIIDNINNITKKQAEAMKTINSSIQQLYASINILVEEAKSLTSE
ncbi:MAG: methyl-accepting chemotaxis protein [Tissierellales bacterium]